MSESLTNKKANMATPITDDKAKGLPKSPRKPELFKTPSIESPPKEAKAEKEKPIVQPLLKETEPPPPPPEPEPETEPENKEANKPSTGGRKRRKRKTRRKGKKSKKKRTKAGKTRTKKTRSSLNSPIISRYAQSLRSRTHPIFTASSLTFRRKRRR